MERHKDGKGNRRKKSQAETELEEMFRSSAGVNLNSQMAQFRRETVDGLDNKHPGDSLFTAFKDPYLKGVNNMVSLLNEIRRKYEIETVSGLLEIDFDNDPRFNSNGKRTKMLKKMQEILRERGTKL